MEILTDYPLKSLNTFNINVDGKYFCRVASLSDLNEALNFVSKENIPMMVLGGGSNVLFNGDFKGLVMKVDFQGITKVHEDVDFVYLKAGAGENWDHFVASCVEKGYGGLENMSLIPGEVGASPVQNIGAYGVEMKDHFSELEYFHFKTRKTEVFNGEMCRFAYRNSIFKDQLKGLGLVLSVTFRLDKRPVLKTGYGTLQDELSRAHVTEPNVADLRSAVIRIRQSKLPDPELIGNAGSFFKNPVVDAQKYSMLKDSFPGLVSYAQSDGQYKLAAGWLIDQCGLKGKRMGEAGVHEKQALVLVNHGVAAGSEIVDLAKTVRSTVFDKFGVELEREVQVI